MILFAADNHYSTHAGQSLFEYLRPRHEIHFHEDNLRCLIEENLAETLDLVTFHLNWIFFKFMIFSEKNAQLILFQILEEYKDNQKHSHILKRSNQDQLARVNEYESTRRIN